MATLAAMVAVLLGATQSKAPPIRFEWSVGEEDVYDLKWTYQKTSTVRGGLTKATEMRDRRSVTAVLTRNEDDSLGGDLLMTIERATWEFGNSEFTVSMSFSPKRKKPISSRIKVLIKKDNRALAADVSPEQARRSAQRQEEFMRNALGGKFTFNSLTNPQQAYTLHEGRQSGVKGKSVFDTLYIQSAQTPEGLISRGQTWKEANIRGRIPVNVGRVELIEYEVTSTGNNGATAKAGLAFPFREPPTGVDKVSKNGKFTYGCSFTFAPEGYVSGSKEFSTFVEKVDAKSQVNKKDSNTSMKQQLTIKKRKPKK